MIPQLLRSEVSVNTGDGNYDAVLVSEFRDLEALRAYREDPRHKAVSALCQIHPHRPGICGLRMLKDKKERRGLLVPALFWLSAAM